jgi:hypothetical protein
MRHIGLLTPIGIGVFVRGSTAVSQIVKNSKFGLFLGKNVVNSN